MARLPGSQSPLEEVVAIDVGTRMTKAVVLRRKGEGFALLNYALVETPISEKGLSPANLGEHLRSVLKGLKTSSRKVTLVLGSEGTVLAHADLPQTSIVDLRRMIKLSPKTYLQQDLKDHVFDCFYRRPGKGDTSASVVKRKKAKILVGGARRSVVEDIQEAARVAGLQLVDLTPAGVALANAFRMLREDSHPDAAALLDLGATRSTINIVQQGELILSRSVALGAEKFADVLSPGGQEGDGAEEMTPEVMQTKLQKAILAFAREVEASAGFYTSQEERHISQLFVSGGTARSQLVLQMLESELSFSCESWPLIRHLQVELPAQRAHELEYEMPQLVVAIGAAIGSLRGDAIRINLLAEAQEAAEARRRDPVRRALMVAGATTLLSLGWVGLLGFEWIQTRHGVAVAEARLKEMRASSGVWSVAAQSEQDQMAISGLERFASERILLAPMLHALQYVAVDGVRLMRVSLDRSVSVAQKPPPKGSKAKPTEERTFHYVLMLQVRNYGDTANYEALRLAIVESAYFKDWLRTNNPVLLVAQGRRQPDTLDPNLEYSLLGVSCHFKDLPGIP